MPIAHECDAHGAQVLLSLSDENVSGAHGEQNAPVVSLPSENPWLGGHDTSFRHASAAQSVSYVVATKAALRDQASAIRRLLQEVKEEVPVKALAMVVAAEKLASASPDPEKLAAL